MTLGRVAFAVVVAGIAASGVFALLTNLGCNTSSARLNTVQSNVVTDN